MKTGRQAKKGCAGASLFLLLMLASVDNVCALDSAAVLPQGMFAIFSENRFFSPVNEVFNQEGNKQSLATPFNNVPLGALFGAPPALNFGTSSVTIDQKRIENEYTLAYGLTNKVTIGAIIPYIPLANTSFNFANNTAGANFGFIGDSLTPCPLGAPGCQTASLTQVNAALASAGFKALGNREQSGFGNVKVGARYQYYSGNYFRGAMTGGVILPTGKEKDPDDLIGQSFGSDVWGLWLELQNDLVFQPPGLGKQLGFPGFGDFYVNYTVKYDMAFPDKQTMRVCPVTNPICTTKADLNRKLGDVLSVEIGPAVGLGKGVILSGFYRYDYKMKNDYSGPADVPVETLERFSSFQLHEWRADLAFTSIPWVMEGKFGLPFVLGVSYRERFAGDNFVNVSRYIGFNFAVYTSPY